MKTFCVKFLVFLACFGSVEALESLQFEHKTKIAVCYFGLTRSTKQVFYSHFKCLFNVFRDNNIDYDVFMHTWSLSGKQRVNNAELDIPIDYSEYKLLKPKFYKIESQDEFTDNLDFGQYFYQEVWDACGEPCCRGEEWWPQLVLNHLCALESQKRVTNMVVESGNDYDLIMYVRPDVFFKNKLNLNQVLDLKPNEILIPNFEHNEGYNDRFAILKYETAPIYGKRIDQIAKFRKEKGRIVSEKYVKYICDQNNLNVRFIELYFDIIRPER